MDSNGSEASIRVTPGAAYGPITDDALAMIRRNCEQWDLGDPLTTAAIDRIVEGCNEEPGEVEVRLVRTADGQVEITVRGRRVLVLGDGTRPGSEAHS